MNHTRHTVIGNFNGRGMQGFGRFSVELRHSERDWGKNETNKGMAVVAP